MYSLLVSSVFPTVLYYTVCIPCITSGCGILYRLLDTVKPHPGVLTVLWQRPNDFNEITYLDWCQTLQQSSYNKDSTDKDIKQHVQKINLCSSCERSESMHFSYISYKFCSHTNHRDTTTSEVHSLLWFVVLRLWWALDMRQGKLDCWPGHTNISRLHIFLIILYIIIYYALLESLEQFVVHKKKRLRKHTLDL